MLSWNHFTKFRNSDYSCCLALAAVPFTLATWDSPSCLSSHRCWPFPLLQCPGCLPEGGLFAPADKLLEEVVSIRWVITLACPHLLPPISTSGHGNHIPPSINRQMLQQENWEKNHRPTARASAKRLCWSQKQPRWKWVWGTGRLLEGAWGWRVAALGPAAGTSQK